MKNTLNFNFNFVKFDKRKKYGGSCGKDNTISNALDLIKLGMQTTNN